MQNSQQEIDIGSQAGVGDDDLQLNDERNVEFSPLGQVQRTMTPRILNQRTFREWLLIKSADNIEVSLQPPTVLI